MCSGEWCVDDDVYLVWLLVKQGSVFLQTHLDHITNMTRRLCERGDEETGKTPRTATPLPHNTHQCNQPRLVRANQLTKSLRVRAVGNYPVKKPVNVGDGHYRILSLDGGGLRAIIETVILSRLIEVFPDLLQRVDLIGTHAPLPGLDYAVRNSS